MRLFPLCTPLFMSCLQLDPLILSCVKGNAVVLDGELVVWNKARYDLSLIRQRWRG